MSLLRLLASGKSLVGVGESRGRYRLAAKGSMPEFGSKPNPFRASARPDLAAAPEDLRFQAPSAQVAEDSTPAVEGKAESPVESRPEPPMSACAELPVPAAPHPETAGADSPVPPAARRRVAWWSRLISRLTSLQADALRGSRAVAAEVLPRLVWRRSKPPGRAPNRFAKSMVQGELSLERVKVVRNDLSDSDLEVVPARGAERPAKRVADANGSQEAATERTSGRLFGASKDVN